MKLKWFYKRVLVTGTVYSLVLYFLLTKSIKEFENTLFIISGGLPRRISNKLKHQVYEDRVWDFLLQSKRLLLRARLIRFFKYNWRFIFAKHYALDHMPFSSHYLGVSRYTLLEDCPGFFCRIDKAILEGKNPYPIERNNSLILYINDLIFHGGCWRKTLGQNGFCKNIIITDSRDLTSTLLSGRKATVVNLKELWDSKSAEEKRWLMSFLDVKANDLNNWNRAKTIILTQTWYTDKILTEQEFVSCYIDSIERYRDTGIIIKPHPRDKFDWQKHFPELQIMDTDIPMQILNFMGVHYDRAITVTSSAVSSFPSDTEIIWLGNEVCPKLQELYGIDNYSY